MDEELIPALSETDMQWIHDRDMRPNENPAGVFGEGETWGGGGERDGAATPWNSGEVTPPAFRGRGLNLHAAAVHSPIDVKSDVPCAREAERERPERERETVMEDENDAEGLHPADAETVPAFFMSPTPETRGRPTVHVNPDKAPDPKKARLNRRELVLGQGPVSL